MKTILLLCLMNATWPVLKSTMNMEGNVMKRSFYGEWTEKKTINESAGAFKVIFFPGGKVNVIRKLQNYIGHYKIYNEKMDRVDGTITIAGNYPFTAAFISPDEMKLIINYGDKSEAKYLIKTKEIKSGFQLINKSKGEAENLEE